MSDLSPALMRFGDVSVRLSVELGRTDMPLRDVLSLGQGSVVALNRLTDELLDITANGKVVAQGEVIAESGKFALRIVNLVGEDPSASAGVSPTAMGTGFPEAARGAAAPMPVSAPPSQPETQPISTANPQAEGPAPAAAISSGPAAPVTAHELGTQEPETPSPPVEEPPADPVSLSEAEPDGLDDILDSTLDELTDALDDIASEEGDDEKGSGV